MADKWSREELILALDFYFRHNPLHISVHRPEISLLCKNINSVNEKRFNEGLSDHIIKRNNNAVYMKLCNFLRFDPAYDGVGLSQGGKLDEVIWREFSEDRTKLSSIAYSLIKLPSVRRPVRGAESERPEGQLLFSLHKRYERNSMLVKSKKAEARRNGKLLCEICGFCFENFYGEIGSDYIECHHIIPLSQYGSEKKTKLEDLILVCANCHRMLHVSCYSLTPDELHEKVEFYKKVTE